MRNSPHIEIEQLTEKLEIYKAEIKKINDELIIQKKKSIEYNKLKTLLWSGPNKYSRSSEIMRDAILSEIGVWATGEKGIEEHTEYISKLDIECIDDLKKITWSDWRKRRIMRYKPGYRKNKSNRNNCRPGKESWKRLQECIKRAKYYK